MQSHSLPVENSAAVRAALLSLVTRQIGPLFETKGLRGQITDWLAPLGTAEIARAIDLDGPLGTCARLTDTILRNSAHRDPGEAMIDVVACTFPRLGAVDRVRLAEFARAVRDLSQANDGTIEDRDFGRAGFSVSEAQRFLPMATRALAALDRRDPVACAGQGDPVGRLIEAGTRAGLRFNPDAPALTAA